MTILPEAFKNQVQSQLKDEYESFVNALQIPSPTSIRLNNRKTQAIKFSENVPWCSTGFYLSERPVFTLDPKFHAGTYYVQEASSMFLEHALKKAVNLSDPLKVLDLCAAPGGKSTHMASLLNEESLLVSNEVIRQRSAILSENIQKWGWPNCFVSNNDPQDFSQLEGFFDVIVIDAPCSGEGLFRKDPEAVNEWSTDNVKLCASRQTRILHDVWPALKEGGLLVYCTCTYNSAENEDNLFQFAKEHEIEFIALSPEQSWNVNTIMKGDIVGYRFFPHKVKGEGFFLSAFRKKESAGLARLKKSKGLAQPSKTIVSRLNEWVHHPERSKFIQHNDLVFSFPENHTSDLELLLNHLRLVYAGTNLATVKHDKLIPEHSLAVSVICNHEAFQKVELSEKEAIQYLRREPLQAVDGVKGFALACYDKVPLGWVNALPNRMNNLYPQEWRIRMNVS